jgi:2-methylisocitrate lyase-like PEP mutase family enzyme
MASMRTLIERPGVIALPGVFDGISARAADAAGFPALYLTGYGAVASALGMPDAGLATYSEMLDRVRCVAGCVRVPFIADGDTGYGGLLNVERTVRGYEQAGAAGIQIEDQEFPKKCGHTQGRRVIPLEDAVAKVRVAVESRSSRDFLIVARTDARTGEGIDAAIARGERFARAGADVVFVESPESETELRLIAERLRGVALLANMVEGGRTPFLPAATLGEMGFKIALYPGSGFLAAAGALVAQYAHLARHGTSADTPAPMLSFADMNTLMGFPRVWEFDRRRAAE